MEDSKSPNLIIESLHMHRVRFRIFIWGGGGGAQKIMCERESGSPLRPGSRAHLHKGPGSSQGF